MRDKLNFTFSEGYYNVKNSVDIPDNCLAATSENVLYDGTRLVSFKGLEEKFNYGGTRSFAVDRDTVVLFGSTSTVDNVNTLNEGIGNAVQATGKNLWFVGNSSAPNAQNLSGGIRVLNTVDGSLVQIGGTAHKEELQLSYGANTSIQLDNKIITSADNTTENLASTAHGLSNGTEVKIYANSVLPTGLLSTTKYYTLPVTGAPTQTKLLKSYYENQFEAINNGDYVYISRATGGNGLTNVVPKQGDAVYFTNTSTGGITSGTEYRVISPFDAGFYNGQFAAWRVQLTTTYYDVVVTPSLTNNRFEVPISVTPPPDNSKVRLYSSIATPFGFTDDSDYYVVGSGNNGVVNYFDLSITPNGTALDITGAGSGEIRVAGGLVMAITADVPIDGTRKIYGGGKVDITSDGTGVFKITRNDEVSAVFRFTVQSQANDIIQTVSEDGLTTVNHGYVNGNEVRVTPIMQLPTGLSSTVLYKTLLTGANSGQDNFKLVTTYNQFSVSSTSSSPNLAVTGDMDLISLYDGFVFTQTPPTGFSTYTLYYVVSKVGSNIQLSATKTGSAITPSSSTSSQISGGKVGFFEDNGVGQLKFTANPFITYTIASSKFTTQNIQVELSDGDLIASVGEKIRNSIRSNSTVTSHYYCVSDNDKIILTAKTFAPDASMNMSYNKNLVTGLNNVSTSTTLTEGAANYSATLSPSPQYCKWNGSYWDAPVQVGLSPLEESQKPELVVTSSLSRGSEFSGLVKGSRTAKVARKRYGAVSIASPSSNLVLSSEKGESLILSIPAMAPDGSVKSANSWLLYFTYENLGSTETHYLFPLEVSEEELDGSVSPTLKTSGNAKYRVVSQHPAVQSQRLVEVEFLDNDLLPVSPEIDYYPADSCKFLAKLGNVMCLIGTGPDLTGFDVSYPNFYEAFPPDWSNWFEEVPVSVSTEQDLGFFWICTANCTYTAEWTGVTESSAPVNLKKQSSIYGAIGEGASVCVSGILFTLSKGKTPVLISPDGRIDDNFGLPVSGFFTASDNFTDKTELCWDENTNSVIYSCGNKSIAYQLDLKRWSAPIILGSTAAPNKFHDCTSTFSINGNAYICQYKVVANVPYLKSYKWHSASSVDSERNWKLTSSFKTGNSYTSLKDIIQIDSIVSSESSSGTLTFYARKNYSLSAVSGALTVVTLPGSGSFIPVRSYAESLDYDTVSAEVTGNRGGQTIHNVVYTVDVHNIERLT